MKTIKATVICIENSGQEDELTINKSYEVLEADRDFYTIINDMGFFEDYVTDRFDLELELSISQS